MKLLQLSLPCIPYPQNISLPPILVVEFDKFVAMIIQRLSLNAPSLLSISIQVVLLSRSFAVESRQGPLAEDLVLDFQILYPPRVCRHKQPSESQGLGRVTRTIKVAQCK